MIGNSKDGLYFLCSRCLKNNSSVNMVNTNPTRFVFLLIVLFWSLIEVTLNSFVVEPYLVGRSKLFITDRIKSHTTHSSIPVVCTSTSSNKNILSYNNSCMNARNIVYVL